MAFEMRPYPKSKKPLKIKDIGTSRKPQQGTVKVPLGKQLEGSLLTPLERINRPIDEKPKYGVEYICRCQCGNQKIVLASPLMRRRVRLCGCLSGNRQGNRKKPENKKVRYYNDCTYPNGRVVRVWVDNGEVISDTHPHWESDYQIDHAKAQMIEVRRKDPNLWNRL